MSASAKSIPNVTIPKTTYRDLCVGTHLTIRLADGSTRDAVVERVGPVDRGSSLLTLYVPGQQALRDWRVAVGAGAAVTEAHLAESDQDHWEDLDAAGRMFGVFDNIGYSPAPIAIFRTKKCADEWLAWDMSRGDDRVVWCDVCVLPIDDLAGRAWNSFDPAPVRQS